MKQNNIILNKKNPCNYGLINNLGNDKYGYKIIKICGSIISSQKCKYCDCYFEMYRTKPTYTTGNQYKLLQDMEKAKREMLMDADE